MVCVDDYTPVNQWGITGHGKAKLHEYFFTRKKPRKNRMDEVRQNPVGALGVLNRHYAWNMPDVREDKSSKRVISADEPIRLDSKLSDNTAIDERENVQDVV